MIHPEMQNFLGGGMDSRWILVFWDQMGINQMESDQIGNSQILICWNQMVSDGILMCW